MPHSTLVYLFCCASPSRFHPLEGYETGRSKSSAGRQQCPYVTNHRNGRSTIRTSAPDLTRFHTESGDVSRRLDTQRSTVVDDVVREVLDRLRLGTASGNRLITPLDSESLEARQYLTGHTVGPRRPPWHAGTYPESASPVDGVVRVGLPAGSASPAVVLQGSQCRVAGSHVIRPVDGPLTSQGKNDA
jgi:hypothetical protein